MTAVTPQLIAAEAARYGVPDWIIFPLIHSEDASLDPAANNGGHVGLLQISADYPGAAGRDLTDPVTNLEVGLPPIAAAYQQEGAPAQPSLQAYDYALTHSGHDQWTGVYYSPESQHVFESSYQSYVAYQADNGVTYATPTDGTATPAGLPSPGNLLGNAGGWIQHHNPLDLPQNAASAGGNVLGGAGKLISDTGKTLLPYLLLIAGIIIVAIMLLGELRNTDAGRGAETVAAVA